jgi:nucleoside-diphosphate-sugar epimerase
VLDESVPLEPPAGDSYGQNKLAAERALGEVGRRGLSWIVLRPTRIYGPFSKTFTERPLKALTEGRLVLGGDSSVPANMVYVDNVVEAVARALDAPDDLSGSAYLITDPEQVSLLDFYAYFADPTGKSIRLLADWRPEVSASSDVGFVAQWTSAFATIARSPQLRGFVHRVIDTDPIGTLPRRLWEFSPTVQRWLLRRFGADSAVIYRPA